MPENEMHESEEKKVDLSWKEQARREKERLAEELDRRSGGEEAGAEEMPEADFTQFVNGIGVQVMMFLGQVENPLIGKRILDLPAAKYNIDMLGILAEKTKGNLTKEEDETLSTILNELRMRYVQTIKVLEKAMAEAPPQAGGPGGIIGGIGGQGGPGGEPPAGGPPKGKIII